MEKIEFEKGYLELKLFQYDLEPLNEGRTVETRWCAEGKVYVHNMDPSSRLSPSRMDKSRKKKEYAVWNRGTMDIDIYVPCGVLNNAFLEATNFSHRFKNLKITPDFKNVESMHVRLVFPKNSDNA